MTEDSRPIDPSDFPAYAFPALTSAPASTSRRSLTTTIRANRGRYRMARAIARSVAIAAITLMIWGLGQIVYIIAVCPPHHAWVRTHAGESEVVLDSGEGVARADDAIFVCETPHH